MAINAYTGLQGSGKSYEAVASVILPAMLAGRRVVTNIDGLNEQLCHAYLVKTKGADPAKLGAVVHFKNDRLKERDFFPDEDHPERDSLVRGGDLVVVDEAWRFWPTGGEIVHEHMQFFRMHRHYTDPATGVTCDLVLMVQAIADLHRSLRAVVELTAKMTKIKTLGLHKTYRVELYEGGRTTKAAKFETFVRRYDKAIFPLYKSYSGGSGTEKTVDKRQNVLLNPRVWMVGVGVLLMGGVSIGYLVHFFKKWSSDGERPVTSAVAPGAPIGTSPGDPPAAARSDISTEWRVAGEVSLRGEQYVVLADSKGHLRFELRHAFVGRGWTLVGTVEGQRVAFWTGGAVVPSSPTPPVPLP